MFFSLKKNNEKYLIVTARNSQSMGLSGHFKHLVLFVATIDNCLFYCINFVVFCLQHVWHFSATKIYLWVVLKTENFTLFLLRYWLIEIISPSIHKKSFPLKSNKKLTNHLKKLQYTIYKLKSNKFNLLLNVRHIIPKIYKIRKKNYWRFFEDIFHL